MHFSRDARVDEAHARVPRVGAPAFLPAAVHLGFAVVVARRMRAARRQRILTAGHAA